jgi:hypothetical protein
MIGVVGTAPSSRNPISIAELRPLSRQKSGSARIGLHLGRERVEEQADGRDHLGHRYGCAWKASSDFGMLVVAVTRQ